MESSSTVSSLLKQTTMAVRYSVRSISLPSKSHPSTCRIDEELMKLKSLDLSAVSTSGSICSLFSGLEDLYISMDELLNLTSTQHVLASHVEVDELLDGSVKLLDVCGVLRDLMAQVKECVRSLQSALRRRKGDSSIESSVASYISFRKKMKKQCKKLVAALKQTPYGQSPMLESHNHHLAAVIRVFREVSAVNASAFQSLSKFFSPPAKSAKWSLVPKLMRKGSVACELKQLEKVSEFETADCALVGLSRSGDAEKLKAAQRGLEDLETSIEGVESCLDSLFRRLIKTRTSLLNIASR